MDRLRWEWEQPYEVCVSLNIKDDQIHADFAGSAPQGVVEQTALGVMEASAGIPILCAIDPEIPHNDGCLRHITWGAPEGSIVKAKYPAATAMPFVLLVKSMKLFGKRFHST